MSELTVSGADAVEEFRQHASEFPALLSFLYTRDPEANRAAVEVVLGNAGGDLVSLHFGGASQVEMQSYSGEWDLRVEDARDMGWEGVGFRIYDGEGNDGEDVRFYAETFEARFRRVA